MIAQAISKIQIISSTLAKEDTQIFPSSLTWHLLEPKQSIPQTVWIRNTSSVGSPMLRPRLQISSILSFHQRTSLSGLLDKLGAHYLARASMASQLEVSLANTMALRETCSLWRSSQIQRNWQVSSRFLFKMWRIRQVRRNPVPSLRWFRKQKTTRKSQDIFSPFTS